MCAPKSSFDVWGHPATIDLRDLQQNQCHLMPGRIECLIFFFIHKLGLIFKARSLSSCQMAVP
jgi:hypothetical protein